MLSKRFSYLVLLTLVFTGKTVSALEDTGLLKENRKKTKEKGIAISSSYASDFLASPQGGKEKGAAHAGSYGLDIVIDFEKFSPLEGLELYATGVWRTGTNLSDKIGNQFPVGQIYGGETVKLNRFYLQKTLFDNLTTIKLGRLNGGDDFLSSRLYGQFVNNGFCGNPIALFFNAPFSAYPNATSGAYIDFNMPHLLIKCAAYSTNRNMQKNRYHGCDFSLKGDEGALLISDLSYKTHREETPDTLVGHYGLGFLYLTGKKPLFLSTPKKGNHTTYFYFDQIVHRSDKKGEKLSLFTTLLFAPKSRDPIPFFLSSGLVYDGLLREGETTSLGVVYGHYSKDLNKLQKLEKKILPLTPIQDFEMVIECNHAFKITPFWTLRPDIQYVIHPKGDKNTQNALVFGAQTTFLF